MEQGFVLERKEVVLGALSPLINPFKGGGGPMVTLLPGARGEVGVYNLAGELIFQSQPFYSNGQLDLRLPGAASGIYLIKLTVTGADGSTYVKVHKLAVAR